MHDEPGTRDEPRTPRPDAFGDAPTQMGVDAPAPDRRRPGQPAFPGGLQRLADRYELEEPIASGGAAVVWRAFDEVLSRSVAIKLLHPHLAGDPTTVERFRLESINAARLTHPNVVQIYDTGQEGDLVFLVMEYVDGPSLRDILADRGALEPSVVAALGEQVASALGEAHAQGVVHRDVKPANILMTSDGVAKVTDFGIAKALSGNQATLTGPGTVVGTAAYVAPEQLSGGPVDARADVYALGVVLHECLTGKPAFQGDTPTATAAARLTHDLLPPRQLRADVPRQLDDVVVRATRRPVTDRYADGTTLALALQPLVRAKPSDVTRLLMSPDGAGGSGDLPITETTYDATGRRPLMTTQTRRTVLAFLAGLGIAFAGFGVWQAVGADDPAPRTGQAPGAGGTPVAIVAAGDFDPYGGDRENPEDVPNVTDGDPSTRWRTQVYNEGLDAIGKPGVGLWFDLGAAASIEAVELALGERPVRVELRYRNDPPDFATETEEAWTAVGSAQLLSGTSRQPVTTTARYWLVWITELAEVDDGGFAAEVAGVRFLGPR
ncbi:MAG: protein kinase domain-containing protein [Actinomycetes bacterium]